MKYFQKFEYEIKLNIFVYVDLPLNLALTCRNWSIISKDSYAKYKWLIVHYGKENALFHAIRLGSTFIDTAIYRTLINEVVKPSYKGSLVHFDKYIETSVFQQKIEFSHASNLPVSVLFTYSLLDEEQKRLPNVDNEELLLSKHLPTAGPHAITYPPISEDQSQNYCENDKRKLIKSLCFLLQQESFLRGRRNTNRMYQLNGKIDHNETSNNAQHASINNRDIIADLFQQTTNDSLSDQLFNGAPFI